MKNSWIIAAISVCLLVGLVIGVVYLEKGQDADLDIPLPAESTATTETTTETNTTTEAGTDWEELLTYRAYLDMTPEERDAFYASFEDPNEFYTWFDAVKAIYEEERKENQMGSGGSIDMGDLDGAG